MTSTVETGDLVESGTQPSTGRRVPVFFVAAAFVVSMLAFGIHLARFGDWVVDDAGVSMAYALNLAHGHGLVAQPGAAPVEAFSNPTWVLLFAALSKVGLFGRGDLFGTPDYVVVVKALAVVLQGVVLAAMWFVIRRMVTVVRGGRPSDTVAIVCWLGAGLLLAANPSYVVWMSSGLENPLMAALVAVLVAVAVRATPTPSARSMIGLGLLSGAIALTRPDGLVYLAVVACVVLLATDVTLRDRWSLLWRAGLAFAALFGSYLAFRVLYFGMWVPNTAVAKGKKGLFSDIEVRALPHAFGWAVVLSAGSGALVACWTMARRRDRRGLRVLVVGLSAIAAGLVAFAALPPDWMGEWRFLTPVWPLLAAAATLGVAQLAALGSARPVRIAVAVLLVALVVRAWPDWRDRSDSFRRAPTVPLCVVAEIFGDRYNRTACGLGLNPAETTLLLPDIGGTLLVSDLRVVDLTGLADRRTAELMRDGDPNVFERYIVDELRPTLIHSHPDWTAASGLNNADRLAADYVELQPGTDWVRRDALGPKVDLATLRAGFQRPAPGPDAPRRACGDLLFG